MLSGYEINAASLSLSPESELEYETGDIERRLKEIIKIQAGNGGEIALINHKELLEEWFPDTGCHIFISHSHQDEGIAIAVANKIFNTYGIRSFIDSRFWGFVDKAIYEINAIHSRSLSDDKYLDYEKCMRVASNFYLVLANALTDGIYKSDSFWFINSANSLNATDDLSEGTYSPWLYTELNYTSTVALAPHPLRPKISLEEASIAMDGNEGFMIKSSSRNFSMRFTPDKSHLTKVSDRSIVGVLNQSREFNKDGVNAIFNNLDYIYESFR